MASYQSYLFNTWLSKRIELSSEIDTYAPDVAAKKLSYPLPLVQMLAKEPQFFKLFIGDLMMPYPYGKPSYVKDMLQSSKLFAEGKIAPTGLLCGSHVSRSQSDAYHLEEPYDDTELSALKGDRRFAWIWPENLSTSYESQSHQLTIDFYLPKGCYATTLLEEIGKREFRPKAIDPS